MEYVHVQFRLKGSCVELTRPKCTRDAAFALIRSPLVERVEITPLEGR